MKLKELFDNYVALDNEARIQEGQKACEDLANALKGIGQNERDIKETVCLFARLAAGSDHFASDEEYELFLKTTGLNLTKNEFSNLVQTADRGDFIATMDAVIDSLNPAAKNAALRFVAAFLASDGNLNIVEEALFSKLED